MSVDTGLSQGAGRLGGPSLSSLYMREYGGCSVEGRLNRHVPLYSIIVKSLNDPFDTTHQIVLH